MEAKAAASSSIAYLSRSFPNEENVTAYPHGLAYARPEMASGEVHRTQLAHERTYLAWWRTGLAGIAAGFGVGRVLPEVVSGTNWPYIALGTALAGAGLAAMVYGIVHYRELQAALREEREPHTGEGFLLALAAVGIVVGAVSVLLVLLSP